ncbi:hypothetical protein WCP94_000099 (plasmid) [Bilophila wadsworthia]
MQQPAAPLPAVSRVRRVPVPPVLFEQSNVSQKAADVCQIHPAAPEGALPAHCRHRSGTELAK